MSNRRGNGEGSIRQRRDGRWEATLSLGNGKRKSLYGRTRKDAARKLTTALKNRQEGLPLPSDRKTLESFLTEWLAAVRSSLRPGTWARYEQYVRLYAIPNLGRVPLTKLSPSHLQWLYAKCLDGGLSATSVGHLHAVLHRALAQALKWGLVARNVVGLVDRPRSAHHEMTTLSVEQSQSFLSVATDDPLHALYALAITTGMRRGELLALRWMDVDLSRAVLRVRGTLQRSGGRLVVSEPKTAFSRRQVHLSATAVDALRNHRARQTSERLRAQVWEDNDLVFANEVGRFIEPGNMLRRSFWPLLRKAGLPRLRFHDLRHTAATLLLGEGVHPKIVSEMLGHSRIGVTMDLYSHVTPTMHEQAAKTVDALLGS